MAMPSAVRGPVPVLRVRCLRTTRMGVVSFMVGSTARVRNQAIATRSSTDSIHADSRLVDRNVPCRDIAPWAIRRWRNSHRRTVPCVPMNRRNFKWPSPMCNSEMREGIGTISTSTSLLKRHCYRSWWPVRLTPYLCRDSLKHRRSGPTITPWKPAKYPRP